MGERTGIEWTDDTWNPVSGCDRISSGCDNCYALTMAKRLKAMGAPGYQNDGDPATSGPGFGVTLHPDRLSEPLRWRKPRRVFVDSMGDLFHDDVPDEYIARVFAVMALAHRHTFQVLTKRHGRMRSLLSSDHFDALFTEALYTVEDPTGHEVAEPNAPWPLPNVWLGVSVEDQRWADIRIPALLDTPAAVRFLSCEPLLGPVDLTPWLPPATCECGHQETEHAYGPRTFGCQGGDGSFNNPICGCRKLRGERVHNFGDPYANHGLHWVIAGGESGRGARPMHPGWARSLRDQCVASGVAFHFKQWGEWAPAHVEDDPAFAGGRAFNHPRGTRQAAVIRERSTKAFTSSPHRTLEPGDETAGGVTMLDRDTVAVRVGKKAAGRTLDGREWSEYPDA